MPCAEGRGNNASDDCDTRIVLLKHDAWGLPWPFLKLQGPTFAFTDVDRSFAGHGIMLSNLFAQAMGLMLPRCPESQAKSSLEGKLDCMSLNGYSYTARENVDLNRYPEHSVSMSVSCCQPTPCVTASHMQETVIAACQAWFCLAWFCLSCFAGCQAWCIYASIVPDVLFGHCLRCMLVIPDMVACGFSPGRSVNVR